MCFTGTVEVARTVEIVVYVLVKVLPAEMVVSTTGQSVVEV